MATNSYQSWGRYPQVSQQVQALHWRDNAAIPSGDFSVLPYGLGRSYGDSCLNAGGMLLDASGLDRFIAFDRERGIVRCEAGVSLASLLKVAVPAGWFLPVTPGTRFVTIGGAIANDVHGKNHHCDGTFGRHVLQLELLRSDGSRTVCSPSKNTDLFKATVGGLGLTGLILWAEIKLRPITGPFIASETIRFTSLQEFEQLSEESSRKYPYTMAWLDCVAASSDVVRGLFMRGTHAEETRPHKEKRAWTLPCDAPGWLLNQFTIRLFNELYYHKQLGKYKSALVHYEPFFYPLDAVLHWNRLYGKQGFFQFQCVLPGKERAAGISILLSRIIKSRLGSFLAVLKEFGDIPSPGLLSFPRPGMTLCLDFANRGQRTLSLLKDLEAIVVEHGGAMYPAKDACMSPASFAKFYPQRSAFARCIDPRFSSSFWRRVTEGGAD